MYKFQLSHTNVNGALLEKTIIIKSYGIKTNSDYTISALQYLIPWYDYKEGSTEEHNLAQEEKSKQKWKCTL